MKSRQLYYVPTGQFNCCLNVRNVLSFSLINTDIGTVTLSASPVEEGEDFTITITLDLPGTGMIMSPPLTVTVATVDGTAGS